MTHRVPFIVSNAISIHIAVAVLFLSTLRLAEAAAVATELWPGAWSTDHGEVVLDARGNQVWGLYAKKGLIYGVYNPKTRALRGIFTHGPQRDFDARRHKWGCFYWRVRRATPGPFGTGAGNTPRSVQGRWRWKDVADWRQWNGRRKGFTRHFIPAREQVQRVYRGFEDGGARCFRARSPF